VYAARRLTHAQAAKLAGLDRLEFDRERGLREIPVHYSEEDWKDDFEAGKCDQ
jgi:predicted HTH domain antitoxin